jgi:WD40 repeat protein
MCARVADDVNDFAVDPQAGAVAVPTDTGDIELLALADLSPLRTLQGGHSNIAGCARFRGDGGELFSGGFDERLVLWDPSNGKRRSVLAAKELLPDEASAEVGTTTQILNPPFILSLAVGPQDSLAVALGDGSLVALPYDQGRPPRGDAPWKARGGHSAPADAIAWLVPAAPGAKASPTLASAGRDCMLRLWAVGAPQRQPSRKQTRRKGYPSASAAASANTDEEDSTKPLASVSLREKPNSLAAASDGIFLVADTSSELTVFGLRG